MSLFQKFINYLRESRSEFRQVNWPTRRDTIKFTLLVVGVSVLVSVFLGALDLFFHYLLDKFIL